MNVNTNARTATTSYAESTQIRQLHILALIVCLLGYICRCRVIAYLEEHYKDTWEY